jgi:hypothetical protein
MESFYSVVKIKGNKRKWTETIFLISHFTSLFPKIVSQAKLSHLMDAPDSYCSIKLGQSSHTVTTSVQRCRYFFFSFFSLLILASALGLAHFQENLFSDMA